MMRLALRLNRERLAGFVGRVVGALTCGRERVLIRVGAPRPWLGAYAFGFTQDVELVRAGWSARGRPR